MSGLNWAKDVKPHIERRLREDAEKRTRSIHDAVNSLIPGTARIIERRVVQRHTGDQFTIEGLSGIIYTDDVVRLLDGKPARFQGRT